MLSPTNRRLPPKELAHKLVSIARYLLLPKLRMGGVTLCPGADRRRGRPPLPFGVTEWAPVVRFDRTLRPLADWEYLHYDDAEGKRHSVQMLYRRWEREGEMLFRTTAPGLEAQVEFRFEEGGFTADYQLTNLGTAPLAKLNLMIGAPGFADRRGVDEVWSGASRFSAEGYRRTFTSYDNLREEADLLTETQAGAGEALENGLRFGGQTYLCTVEGGWDQARCAHVNKRRYLTSHVYADYASLAPGASLGLSVQHRLSPPCG